MRRASDDVLKQRTILKATKLSPPKGATRATAVVIHQRKIVKANRSWFGEGSSPPTPRSPAAPATATPKQRNDATSPCPNPSATSIPEPKAVGLSRKRQSRQRGRKRHSRCARSYSRERMQDGRKEARAPSVCAVPSVGEGASNFWARSDRSFWMSMSKT